MLSDCLVTQGNEFGMQTGIHRANNRLPQQLNLLLDLFVGRTACLLRLLALALIGRRVCHCTPHWMVLFISTYQFTLYGILSPLDVIHV
jgi:hypothetical protein